MASYVRSTCLQGAPPVGLKGISSLQHAVAYGAMHIFSINSKEEQTVNNARLKVSLLELSPVTKRVNKTAASTPHGHGQYGWLCWNHHHELAF